MKLGSFIAIVGVVVLGCTELLACNSILGIPEVERLPPEAGAVPNGGTCGEKTKSCGGRCVDTTSPVTGCAAASCEACKLANAAAACADDGSCVVASCASGWENCDNLQETGCEQKLGEPSNCITCGDKCGPGFVCQGADVGCACTDAAACNAGGTGTCENGRCMCPGETEPCLHGWGCSATGCTPPSF